MLHFAGQWTLNEDTDRMSLGLWMDLLPLVVT